MKNKLNMLYGIIAGFALAFLQLPLYIGIQNFGDMGGYRLESIIKLFSWVGIMVVIFFSCLLIFDILKELYK